MERLRRTLAGGIAESEVGFLHAFHGHLYPGCLDSLHVSWQSKDATSNKCITSSNKCLTSSNKKLVETMRSM